MNQRLHRHTGKNGTLFFHYLFVAGLLSLICPSFAGCNRNEAPVKTVELSSGSEDHSGHDHSHDHSRQDSLDSPSTRGNLSVNGKTTSDLKKADLKEDLWTTRGEDWPEFLGDDRNGKSNEKGILTDWTSDKLKVVWQTDVGEGYGIGSISKGRYYQFDRDEGAARLRCLHAESGRLLWEFKYQSNYVDTYGYDSGPRCSPVIDQGKVYIFGVEGLLHCLNAVNGEKIWSFDTTGKYGVVQNFFGIASTPVIHDDLLIVMVGGSPAESQDLPAGQLDQVEPNHSAIVAFDKLTGAVNYASVNDLASYVSLKVVSIDGQDILLAWAREKIHGLDPTNGEELFSIPWRARTLESVNASTPVVSGNKIFISECYGPGSMLFEVVRNEDTWEPTILWKDDKRRDKSLQAHWNTPILHEGKLYASSGRHTNEAELRCVDLETGKVHWTQPGLTRCSLTYVDEHLVVMAENGMLFLAKATPERFEMVTRYDTLMDDKIKFRYPCWAAPIVSHGLMFIRGKDKLVCFRLIEQDQQN